MKDAANAQEVSKLKAVLEALSRQVVISEVGKEQRVRYEGGSGLTQVRDADDSSPPFLVNSRSLVGCTWTEVGAPHPICILSVRYKATSFLLTCAYYDEDPRLQRWRQGVPRS